jgi:hypothetical protein
MGDTCDCSVLLNIAYRQGEDEATTANSKAIRLVQSLFQRSTRL